MAADPLPRTVFGFGDPDDPAVAARRRLANSARTLFDALVSSSAPPELMDGTARELDRLASVLEPDGRTSRYHGTGGLDFDGGDNGTVFETHPIVGPGNPMAPPVAIEHTEHGVVAHATYDHRFEGTPGCVHGGLLSAAFDVILGGAASRAGYPIVTGTLTVRYRRPTPLHTPLRFEGQLDGVDGRQVFSSARVLAGDEVTAEAEAVFITVGRERFRTD
jgi:acyl-coenzyme A thioesterase PaaI-like protein